MNDSRWLISFGYTRGNVEEDEIESATHDSALDEAWHRACDIYDYECSDARTLQQIMDQDVVSEEEAYRRYKDERAEWLVYSAIQIFKDAAK